MKTSQPNLRTLDEEIKKIENPDTYQLPADIQEHVNKLFPSLQIPQKTMPAADLSYKDQEDLSALENPEEEDILTKEFPNPIQDSINMPQVSRREPPQVEQEIEKIATQPQNRMPADLYKSNIENLMKQKNEEEDRIALARAGDRLVTSVIGAGAGKILTPDLSRYDEMQKRAARPLIDLQLKQELEDKQSQTDPNSELSKMTRKSLEELGMNMEGFENVSYSQIAKMYPTLAQSLYTKITAKANVAKAKLESQVQREKILELKKEKELERDLDTKKMLNENSQKELDRRVKQQENVYSRELRRELDGIKQGNEAFNKQMKVSTSIGSAVDRMKKSKPYIAYDNASSTRQMIEAALNDEDNEGKVAKAAAAMGYFKSAQGDDSVVKSEDMKVLLGGFNATSVRDMLKKIESKLQGSPVSDIELSQMLKVIKRIEDIKKRTLDREYLTPIESAAKKFNYDLIEVSPEFRQEVKNYEPSLQEQKIIKAKRRKEIDDRVKELEKKELEKKTR